MAGQPDQPANIGQQLGLGRNWQPTSASWRWAQVMSPQGLLHVLIVEGREGTHAMVLSEDALRRFIDGAMAEASGLHVARDPLPAPQQVGLGVVGG